MTENTSLIVNEKRLPATIKRLFRGTVYEIVGELLQNAQRAGASEIYFRLDREAKLITVCDNGSGILSDSESWSKLLRMADSFYRNETVEKNQKPMGLGLLSLFALEAVETIRISSRRKTVLIDAKKLWEIDGYWANWTKLIEKFPDRKDGFELIISYQEPETISSFEQLANKFEIALTKVVDSGGYAAPRGYENYLRVFLNGKAVDTSIPAKCVPAGANLIIDTAYEGNRLRIGQSLHDFSDHGYVVWYGQIIKVESNIPFLLEVSTGSPVTPLAPTRHTLVKDRKLENLRQFVEDTVFETLAKEKTARRMNPQFIKRLYRLYSARAMKELPVCVVREIYTPANGEIDGYDDFYDLGEEKVLTYRQIEKDRIDIFESHISRSRLAEDNSFYAFDFNRHLSQANSTETSRENQTKENDSPEWFETSEGLPSFAAVLGGTIRRFIAGNRQKLPLKKIYWKPGEAVEKFFVRAGEYAVVSANADPTDADFRPVNGQIFVFEYTGNFDIEEIDGLCAGLPISDDGNFIEEAAKWLTLYGKACFSPSDDYDYDQQESDFDASISRLILELRRDTLSTNWNFSELKSVVGRTIIAAGNGHSQNSSAANISQIKFTQVQGETALCVKLDNGQEVFLKVAAHTYVN